MNEGLQRAINRVCGVTNLARKLGVTRSAIYQWGDEIPANRLVEIERLTGVPREQLRPDLYRHDKPADAA